jgi:hypothetical protein
MDWYQAADIMTDAKAYMILHPQVLVAISMRIKFARRRRTQSIMGSENFKNHFERMALQVFGGCCDWTPLGFVWFWHLFMPLEWHWLSFDQVTQVQNFLTGGVVAAVATGHFKRLEYPVSLTAGGLSAFLEPSSRLQ